MRWDFVAQAAGFARHGILLLIAQVADFQQQAVDLLLLAIDGAIKRVELVFGEAELYFEFIEA